MSEDVPWPGLEEDLNNQDWDRTFAGLQPTQMMHKFLEICTTTAQFVPVRQHTKRPKSHRISRPRRILMRRRTKVNKQLAGKPSEAKRHRLVEEARSIEKKLQESYWTETSSMEHKAVSAIKRNPKYFFNYARKFSKMGTGIGPLIDATKEIISCPIRIAGKLAEQYTTVFSSPSEPLLSPEEIFRDMEARHATNLCDIQFTETDICQAMAEMSSSASAGPDRFPAILLKNCRKILSRPLYKILRKSQDSGEIPPLMKRANIIPVHKGGSLGLPKNYRPIALTSYLIKVFEKVIRTAIVS